MKLLCRHIFSLVSVFFFAKVCPAALNGPSLMDDLLLPYDFDTPEPVRRARSIQNPNYNYTYETFRANSTSRMLPISTTKYFVSDVVDPIYFYKKTKAYGHLTSVTNPLHSFSVLEPLYPGGCSENITATVEMSSRQRHCIVAQNGGFFNTEYGSCLGNIISDGRVVKIFDKIQNANFGITNNGTIVTGYLDKDDIENLEFKQLIGGAIWLVRNGASYVEEAFACESADIQQTGTLRRFIDVQSARTAIGHDSSGRVVMVNIEGQTGSRGVNLNQFAKLLIDEFHLVNAINLDGGGSATVVLNNTLANFPSDHCREDPEWRCARAITTILCVHDLECDVNCVNGDCVLGSCHCHDNYKGSACDELYCHNHNCSEHGICTPGGCVCSAGWHGKDCSVPCGPKYFGVNCVQQCQCRNNASCDSVSGSCSCLPGFEGALCDRVCPLGRYGRNCENLCHCEESCGCDAVTGVCLGEITQSEDADSTVAVASCLANKKESDAMKNRDGIKTESFHWVAVLCTAVGLLAVSLATNIYLLLMRANADKIRYCYVTNDAYDEYMPLRSSKNMMEPSRIVKSQVNDNLELTPSDKVERSNNLKSGRPTSKTRPYTMSDRGKMRAKWKLPTRQNFRFKDGYRELPTNGSVYEETALLSQ